MFTKSINWGGGGRRREKRGGGWEKGGKPKEGWMIKMFWILLFSNILNN
jgi:hypothetical protein